MRFGCTTGRWPRSKPDMATPVSPPPPDTGAPVVSGGPTGTLPAGTTSATLQVTTNENATCRYATTPGTAYAQMATTFATTGATAHSHGLTGLANGQSYTFYVRCQDPAGNATTADTVVSFAVANPPTPDSVPPTVALTAPAAGATVSGSVNVTADVPGQRRGGGRAVPPRRGQPRRGGHHGPVLGVVEHPRGHERQPHPDRPGARRGGQHRHLGGATVTVTNAASTGLVAAYAFDEGTGTTVRDASPSAVNNGTVSGAVWAAGRYGGGRFDGTNDVVTVPDAASLDLTAT